MKRRLTAILLCLFLGTLSGCGDTHDSIAKELLATVNETADTLATIKDKASAEAAKSKLKKLGDKLKDLKARDDKLGKVTEDEKKKLEDKYKKDFETAIKKLLSESIRVASVPGGQDATKELNDAMQKIGEDKK